MLDVSAIKKDFPIFDRTVRDGQRLIYLDSGATSQKPNSVIDAESNFYRFNNAAVHRGAHQLAEEATENFENARSIVAEFIGAKSDEIVFTKSATESINLVAYALTEKIKPGDRIVVSEM
jgi:cysteine desulfurase/selenocysteine lyase